MLATFLGPGQSIRVMPTGGTRLRPIQRHHLQRGLQNLRSEPTHTSHSIFFQQPAAMFAHPLQCRTIFDPNEAISYLLNRSHENYRQKHKTFVQRIGALTMRIQGALNGKLLLSTRTFAFRGN